MIESCCAVTSYYCFKCVCGVSVELASQRQTWISKAKVYSRLLKGDKPKNIKIEQSEKQLFLKRIA